MRQPRSDETLTKACEAVRFEAVMLSGTLDAMLQRRTEESSPPGEQLVWNALLNSFLVAARNLCKFLYSHKPHANDIIAEDFFDDPSEWKRIRYSLPEFLDGSFARDISRRSAHLTYDRTDGTKMRWITIPAASKLSQALEAFSLSVKPARCREGLVQDLAAFKEYLRRLPFTSGSIDDVNDIPLSEVRREEDS